MGCGRKADATKTIQVFGDSNARGESSVDPLEPNGVTTGFAVPLAKALAMNLDNRALGGSEIRDQAVKVETYGKTYTDIKLIMAGYNDAYFQTTVDDYKTLLYQMIVTMASHSRLVVVVTTTQYSPNSKMGPSNPYAIVYRNADIEVVRSFNNPNVQLIDVYYRWNPDPSKFVPDTVHYNKTGSAELVELIMGEIR